MIATRRRLTFTALAAGALTLAACTQDGGMVPAEGDAKARAQAAMEQYIEQHTVDGVTHYYDPIEGRMLTLTFDYLHDGVKQKGPYHVSCADFTDQYGRTLDFDYFVIEDDGTYRVTQGLLHKVDGKKRPYDLQTGNQHAAKKMDRASHSH